MRYPQLTGGGRLRPTRSRPPQPGSPQGQPPPLVAVAHGSADPRAAAAITDLMAVVRARARRAGLEGLQVRAAYLGHALPSVADVLEALSEEALSEEAPSEETPSEWAIAPITDALGPGPSRRPGHPPINGRRAVVVLPLLLTAAYHSDTDLPAVLHEAAGRLPRLRISYGDPLGPHPSLVGALERRLAEAGTTTAPGAAARASTDTSHGVFSRSPAGPARLPVALHCPPPLPLHCGTAPSGSLSAVSRSPAGAPEAPSGSLCDTAVVLAAAGSSRPGANAAVAQVAAAWQSARGWRSVIPAFASAASPAPAEAVTRLLRAGTPRVAVASYLLAPGFFADQVRETSLAAGAEAVSGALGAAPEVADVLLERYLQVTAATARPAGALSPSVS